MESAKHLNRTYIITSRSTHSTHLFGPSLSSSSATVLSSGISRHMSLKPIKNQTRI